MKASGREEGRKTVAQRSRTRPIFGEFPTWGDHDNNLNRPRVHTKKRKVNGGQEGGRREKEDWYLSGGKRDETFVKNDVRSIKWLVRA